MQHLLPDQLKESLTIQVGSGRYQQRQRITFRDLITRRRESVKSNKEKLEAL